MVFWLPRLAVATWDALGFRLWTFGAALVLPFIHGGMPSMPSGGGGGGGGGGTGEGTSCLFCERGLF